MEHRVNGFCFPQKRDLPFAQLVEIPDLKANAENDDAENEQQQTSRSPNRGMGDTNRSSR